MYETIDELSVKKILLPKLKKVLKANLSDLKITASVLYCIEVLMDKMERVQVSRQSQSCVFAIFRLNCLNNRHIC